MDGKNNSWDGWQSVMDAKQSEVKDSCVVCAQEL